METSFLQHESKIEDSLQFFPDNVNKFKAIKHTGKTRAKELVQDNVHVNLQGKGLIRSTDEPWSLVIDTGMGDDNDPQTVGNLLNESTEIEGHKGKIVNNHHNDVGIQHFI